MPSKKVALSINSSAERSSYYVFFFQLFIDCGDVCSCSHISHFIMVNFSVLLMYKVHCSCWWLCKVSGVGDCSQGKIRHKFILCPGCITRYVQTHLSLSDIASSSAARMILLVPYFQSACSEASSCCRHGVLRHPVK